MDSTTETTLTAEQVDGLNKSNLIGGILIGVTASYAIYHAVRWTGRKVKRFNRQDKKEVEAQKS